MSDLIFVLGGSLLGSAHCLGMCGGFAVTLGLHGGTWRQNLSRQLLYGAGRICTYSCLGMLAGGFGLMLGSAGWSLLPWQAMLAIAAGICLIGQGMHAAGWRFPAWKTRLFARPGESYSHPRKIPELTILQPSSCAQQAWCASAKLFHGLLAGHTYQHTFLAGVLTGLLPCGLVYAFLALAASRATPFEAWLTMAVFGLGTIPLMTLLGLGAGWCSLSVRRRLWKIAAICLMITGGLSIWRGAYAWHSVTGQPTVNSDPSKQKIQPCPFCAVVDEASPS
ncbi:MAG: sulfite exporter TauE/SafE family protein [Pirellulales bacterium]|nr:sulfite exporter TauE/SafE family protein [Pirellulales bacterium]